MSSLTSLQNAAVTVMDYLLISDVASMSTFSDSKNKLYSHLLGTIDYINSVRGHNSFKAEIYQHFILCAIELLADYSKVSNQLLISLNNIMNEIICEIKIHGFLEDEFRSDVYELNKEYNFSNLNKETHYKLVAQVLYFDFDNTTIAVLNKLTDINVLKSEKIQLDKVAKKQLEIIDKCFIRAMLFCEFEILKKKWISKEHLYLKLDQIAEEIPDQRLNKSIISINLDKKEIEAYLNQMSKQLNHKRLFFKNMSDCLGLIGCWFLFEAHAKDKTLTVHRETDLTSKDEKRPTCSEIASMKVYKYGLTIRPRAIYNHYSRFYKFYLLIKDLFENQSKIKFNFILPDINETLFNQAGLNNSFGKALQQSNSSLKK